MSFNHPNQNKGLRGVLIYGGEQGKKYKLRPDSTVIGRERSDILLHDPLISTTHCQIQVIEGRYQLFDLNSSNGSYVNGQPVIKAILKDGDKISLGETEMVFRLEEEGNLADLPAMSSSKGSKFADDPGGATTKAKHVPAATQRLRLDIEYPDKSREVIEMDQSIIYIGRAAHFGKFDVDSEISRKHLMIKLNEKGEVFASDLKSTNGSFLNGEKMSEMHQVSSKDIIKIGGCTLSVKVI